VAQSVKQPTLDLTSGLDLRVVGLSSAWSLLKIIKKKRNLANCACFRSE